MAAIDDETDLADSPAAAVNRPPVGDHDASDVPDYSHLLDDGGDEGVADD